MRSYVDTDMYQFQNKNDSMLRRITTAIKSVSASTVLNNVLNTDLALLTRSYPEAVTIKAVEAIRSNNIVLTYFDNPTIRLPDMMPFVKVKRGSETSMLLDISRYVRPNPDWNEDMPEDSKYRVNITKFHDVLIPAYISHTLIKPTTALPFETIRDLAIIWADVINQVLNRIGIFAGNSDRKDAFRYFSMIFYMKYYLECPDAVVKNVSEGILQGGKNQIIMQMEDAIQRLDAKPYSSFTEWCHTMFNTEVNGIRGLESAVTKMLNFPYFVHKYAEMYGPEALGAFYGVDYFIYILYIAYRKADIVRDRAFEYVIGAGRKNVMPKLLNSLYKEL